MIDCKYNTEREILEVVYSGLVTLVDLNMHGSKVMNNKNIPRNLNILTDARDAVYDYENINYFSMMKNMIKHLEPYNFVKNAILHSKPIETAVSMIVEEKIIIPNYKQKIFNTEEAAMNWLLNR